MHIVLSNGECSKLSRTSSEDIWSYFLATPLEPDRMNRALEICRQCDIIAKCFVQHFENDCVIAGGTDPYRRKVIRWKRVEHVGDTNWRSVDEFVGNFRGKEK